MNIRTAALLAFGFGVLITGSSWAGEVSDGSAIGAMSIGAGALAVISSPLIVTAGAVTGDSEMIKNGLLAGAFVPSAVVAGVGGLAIGSVQTVGSAGREIVHMVHSSGEKLAELNEKVFDQVTSESYNHSNTPTAQAKIKNQQATIPLVVRKQYVEMNEKVAK